MLVGFTAARKRPKMRGAKSKARVGGLGTSMRATAGERADEYWSGNADALLMHDS